MEIDSEGNANLLLHASAPEGEAPPRMVRMLG